MDKKSLVDRVLKETKPPEGWGQWLVILQVKRVTKEIGLFRLEWYSNGKIEWSGGLSVEIARDGKSDNFGTETKWDEMKPGASKFNVLTAELRSKSLWENTQTFFKRSFDGAKIQDFIPFLKK